MAARLCLFAAALTLLTAACSTTPDAGNETAAEAPAPKDSPAEASAKSPGPVQPLTEYYVGDVTMYSPDGNMALGPKKSTVAKRLLFPAEARIEEWVWDEGKLVRTTMTRNDDGSFAVTEDQGRFVGTMNFEGKPWSWDKWTYDLAMADGSGKLWGTGAKRDGQLFTNKKLMSPEGEVRVQIRDTLTLAEEPAFEQALQKLRDDFASKKVPMEKPTPGDQPAVPAG